VPGKFSRAVPHALARRLVYRRGHPRSGARAILPKNQVRRAFCVVLAALGLLACAREKSEFEEARALLERISALDPGASGPQRKARLDALSALPLTDPALARLRDQCFLAHGGLLRAELEQAAARARLSRLEGRDAAAPDVQQQAAVAAEEIRRSDAALADARGPFDQCTRETRALTLRLR
jgi:hypothetical protein